MTTDGVTEPRRDCCLRPSPAFATVGGRSNLLPFLSADTWAQRSWLFAQGHRCSEPRSTATPGPVLSVSCPRIAPVTEPPAGEQIPTSAPAPLEPALVRVWVPRRGLPRLPPLLPWARSGVRRPRDWQAPLPGSRHGRGPGAPLCSFLTNDTCAKGCHLHAPPGPIGVKAEIR